MPLSDACVATHIHDTQPHGPLTHNHIASSSTHSTRRTQHTLQHHTDTHRRQPDAAACCSSPTPTKAPSRRRHQCRCLTQCHKVITERYHQRNILSTLRLVLTVKAKRHQATPWMKQEREQRIQSLQTSCERHAREGKCTERTRLLPDEFHTFKKVQQRRRPDRSSEGFQRRNIVCIAGLQPRIVLLQDGHHGRIHCNKFID
jgi:hypothetical protein